MKWPGLPASARPFECLRVSGVAGRQWLRINGLEGPLVLSPSKYERGVGKVY